MPPPRKPTRAEIAAAHGKETVPDIVGPKLDVLFVGINPGLYSGATGRHFARPGNRFWPALHQSGFTPRLLHPPEEHELLEYGIGMSKLVHRATATAAELDPSELRRGGSRIRLLVRRLKPKPSASSASAHTARRTASKRRPSAASRSPWKAPISGCFRTPAA